LEGHWRATEEGPDRGSGLWHLAAAFLYSLTASYTVPWGLIAARGPDSRWPPSNSLCSVREKDGGCSIKLHPVKALGQFTCGLAAAGPTSDGAGQISPCWLAHIVLSIATRALLPESDGRTSCTKLRENHEVKIMAAILGVRSPTQPFAAAFSGRTRL